MNVVLAQEISQKDGECIRKNTEETGKLKSELFTFQREFRTKKELKCSVFKKIFAK